MHRKATGVALAALSRLLSPTLAGEPLYDPNPGHSWDQARDIFYVRFYVRRFPTGETFEHPHAFAPPWTEYLPFVDLAVGGRVVAEKLQRSSNRSS